MAEPTKKELVDDAEAVGIDDPEKLTKPEIEQALETRAPSELGPVIREGEDAPEPKASGAPTKGVQPLTESDIPKAGR